MGPPAEKHGEHDVVSSHHPTGFWFFFWGEFAERCSYYGMRAILFLYLTDALKFSDNTAGPIYSCFKMGCYFLPLLGGYIADRYFGKYWTIVGFSIPYVLGHFILGIENPVALVIALILLACGSGVIKPNISTLMGLTYDQQRPGQERLRSAAFLWFYFSINVGAVISNFALPAIRDWKGYTIAFQFPAWIMFAALLIFALGKKHYAAETPGVRTEITEEERRQRWQTLGQLFGFFGLMVCFWIPYEHNDTLWVAFSRDYVDRYIPLIDRTVPPDQISFLNPLFVLILIPLFNGLFKRIDPELRIFTAYKKILLGFIMTSAAIGLMSLAGFLVQGSEQKLSIVWMAFAYITLTVGEVLLYGTGLELAYTAAPKSLKGFVTACFLVTNALGNLVNVGLTRLYGGSLVDAPENRGPLAPGVFFGASTLIVVTATIVFYFYGKRFTTHGSPPPANDEVAH